jgi:hypothetical protein
MTDRLTPGILDQGPPFPRTIVGSAVLGFGTTVGNPSG